MKRIRCNRKYNQATDLEVSNQGGRNISGFTANPDLPSPPEPAVELTAKKDAFDQWVIKAANKGTYENEQKDATREILLTALNKDASYTDIMCYNHMGILLSSGFEPVSDNRTQVVLLAPVIQNAIYVQSGQIRLIIKGDRHRKIVQGRIKPVGAEFGPVITFESPRNILYKDLTPGTTYVMQLCALGGSTGMSDWSEPLTKVAV